MSEPTATIPNSPGGLPARGPAWRRGLAIIGAWSIPAIASAVSTLASLKQMDTPPPYLDAVVRSSFFWVIFAVLTPPVLWLVWRYPWRAGGMRSRVALHVAACVIFAIAAQVLIVAVSLIIDDAPITLTEWRSRFGQNAAFTLISGLFYWVIFIAGASIDNARIARTQRDRATLLERQLAEARLHALRGQIQPHFLFNTLNSIASLVRQGASERALEMINRLGALLRTTLRDADARPVPLHEELEFIEQYLAIEQARLGDRLRVRYDIDADARDVPLPSLLVQPLVENAIRHGIAPEPEGGELVISAHVERDRLEIRVTNDGAALDISDSGDDVGIGLRNIRARIEAAYNSRGSLQVQPRPGGGAVAILVIPRETEIAARETDS